MSERGQHRRKQLLERGSKVGKFYIWPSGDGAWVLSNWKNTLLGWADIHRRYSTRYGAVMAARSFARP